MKFWVLAAVISFGLAQQAAKSPNSAAAKGAHVANPASSQKTDPYPGSSAASAAMPNVATSQQQAASSSNNQERPELEAKLTWFIGALAVVAILQLLTLLWQGFALGKMMRAVGSQAHQMEHQSSAMDRQLRIMEEQLAALKDTASAASATAIAAKENVELIVRKERARLRIDLEPFYLNFNAPSAASFTIQHQGSTDAFVLNSRAAIYVSESRDPDPLVGSGKPLPIPNVIRAKDPAVVAQDVLHPFTREEIDSIRQLKSFVHFTGFVRYKDVFDGEHETRFNKVWSIARVNNLGGEPFTYWEHCGAADQNIET
jgi:hypothetical protein